MNCEFFGARRLEHIAQAADAIAAGGLTAGGVEFNPAVSGSTGESVISAAASPRQTIVKPTH